jgi:hypothetical protein
MAIYIAINNNKHAHTFVMVWINGNYGIQNNNVVVCTTNLTQLMIKTFHGSLGHPPTPKVIQIYNSSGSYFPCLDV